MTATPGEMPLQQNVPAEHVWAPLSRLFTINRAIVGPLYLAAAAVILGILVWATQYKVHSDWQTALENHRFRADQVTHNAVVTIDGKFRHIRQTLRTIGMLPSVRSIDRHGKNIDATAKESVQQLYNNLKENVEISEIYIVPVTLEADKIDPLTGKPEEPILMFDELIVNAAAKARAAGTHKVTETEDEPEVEIFEYRALQQQMAWLQAHYPSDSVFSGLQRPMIASQEVITCDNTLYIHSHIDADRAGIILSVPFYGFDGVLKGTLSATLRSEALARYLPAKNFALLNKGQNYRVLSVEPGIERTSLGFVDKALPDPNLIYSTTVKLNENDPHGEWVVWSGRPDDDFLTSSDAYAVRTFMWFAYLVIAFLVVMVAAAFMFFRYQILVAEGLRTKQDELDDMLAKLLVARDQARAGSQAKSDFLAAMSHEIRTPMNGVLGMAQSLFAANIPPAERQKVSVILETGGALLTVLNDVLDFSNIETGRFKISPVPGDIVHTLKGTIRLFEEQANDKGIELVVNFAPDIPPRLVFDAVRVGQCVGNLLSNAIKFTMQGRVTVSASSKPTHAGDHVVQVEITDSGIGISGEVQAKLFSAFTQADGTITRRFGGTGLGLAISRRLAQLMDGDIAVESTEGKGSRFILTFRGRASQALPDREPAKIANALDAYGSAITLRGKRILLTDDVAINRQVIKLFLAPQGCEMVEATNGLEALERLAESTFDVVLLDVHMPVMDGRIAIQRIRSSPEPWRNIPVIALTADAMIGDRDTLLALGMTEYMAKPVDQRALVAKLNKVLHLESNPDLKAAG
jgi:signal transduction histidine kinase/CheY-like chemotaxis protein